VGKYFARPVSQVLGADRGNISGDIVDSGNSDCKCKTVRQTETDMSFIEVRELPVEASSVLRVIKKTSCSFTIVAVGCSETLNKYYRKNRVVINMNTLWKHLG